MQKWDDSAVESVLSPQDAARLLHGVDAHWWVAGGWAIDLWLGEQTRHHVDLDIAVLRDQQQAFRERLAGWDLHLATSPGVLEPLPKEVEVLEPLHAIWCRQTPESKWAFELLLNDSDGRDWLFRRDHAVRLPISRLGECAGDVPFLRPEVVLLFKAKNVRAHDQLDFEHARERMDSHGKQWLRQALERVHPGHEWIHELD